ncbi:hypothetical protein T4B_5381 [Trichinella pseudospiralis]|uniref:Uncharacterized protein n=1 Tax=Trichinella pseudospiralis TaxID=6337 RepID=A0A0V1GBM3_TRIPS|nr:hypothetical protein T4B_5381 [Trichinella pseudospiralis]KRY96768.1 hypothetical protein T4C_1550 [Trichinella pseudospiralis]
MVTGTLVKNNVKRPVNEVCKRKKEHFEVWEGIAWG